MNDDAEWIEDEEKLGELCEDYFMKLFSSVGEREWSGIISHVSNVLSGETNDLLTRPVTEEEIKRVVFSIGAF